MGRGLVTTQSGLGVRTECEDPPPINLFQLAGKEGR